MPWRPARRCLGCGRLVRGASRCSPCKKIARSHYAGSYPARSAAVRASAKSCWLCDGGPKRDDPWQADHVIPGDPDSELRPAHESCNKSRGNAMWEPRGGRITRSTSAGADSSSGAREMLGFARAAECQAHRDDQRAMPAKSPRPSPRTWDSMRSSPKCCPRTRTEPSPNSSRAGSPLRWSAMV
jgi:hypothetical protein